jgi:hypothetical protein
MKKKQSKMAIGRVCGGWMLLGVDHARGIAIWRHECGNIVKFHRDTHYHAMRRNEEKEMRCPKCRPTVDEISKHLGISVAWYYQIKQGNKHRSQREEALPFQPLPIRLRGLLRRHGINTDKQLSAARLSGRLRKIPGVGSHFIELIDAYLKSYDKTPKTADGEGATEGAPSPDLAPAEE